MSYVSGLCCVKCHKTYGFDELWYLCPDCGSEGLLDVVYDYAALGRKHSPSSISADPDRSIWRYLPLLPIEEDTPLAPLQIGMTPLYGPDRLRRMLKLPNLYIKDDGRNPSASFKDRASAVGLARALELKQPLVTCASTGNAASSLAGVAASVGMPVIIFVPERAPRAKVAQLLIYGARVLMVRGTYDQAFDLCWQATLDYGWYSRNTGFNPVLLEGKKTAALEICEQLGWKAPDRVVVSVGDGCIIGGLWKGFHDLKSLGWIEKVPALVGVQAEGASPMVKAFKSGGPVVPEDAQTIADSISVGTPRAAGQALRGLRETPGSDMVAVSDQEIMEAMSVLSREAGVFGEPAGVTAMAGLRKMAAQGTLDPEETVVVLITGNGLKDVESALKVVGEPTMLAPDPADLKKLVDSGALGL